MNGIPTAPTDSIYKFMAISGLWFIAGFIVIYIWLINVQIQLDKDIRKSQLYFFSVGAKREIENRLNSIASGKINESRLSWVPSTYTLEQEKSFIYEALKSNQDSIDQNKAAIENKNSNELNLVERWDVRIAASFYIALMIGLTWFGFSRWVTKIHEPDEAFKKLDKEIKENMLEKIKSEIKQIKLDQEIKQKSIEKIELEIKQMKLAAQANLRLRRAR